MNINARYNVSWRGYPNNPADVEVQASYFTDGNGFSRRDKDDIYALGVDGVYQSGGPFDCVTVTRIEDKKSGFRGATIQAYNEDNDLCEIEIDFSTEEGKWQVWINSGILGDGREVANFDTWAEALTFAQLEAEIVEAN